MSSTDCHLKFFSLEGEPEKKSKGKDLKVSVVKPRSGHKTFPILTYLHLWVFTVHIVFVLFLFGAVSQLKSVIKPITVFIRN